jgi:preprotein translocase subunit SecA
VLLGTTSIAKSEAIAERLKAAGIPHAVLNAKQHEREAEIIMQAGRKGAVTVATNMAGRGTDIVLGGKPEALWRTELAQKNLAEDAPEAQALLAELKTRCKAEHDEIKALGGLYVVGTERHEARRIDNQLRGRCGRQGDPGQTKFFLSFDDDLMRIFARDWVKVMMEKMGLKSGEVIDSPMVSRGIAKAQKKVEARNFDIRKHLLEYDEVMDKQRKFVYGQRQEALERQGLRAKALGMFDEVMFPIVERYAGDKDKPVDYAELTKWLRHRCDEELDLTGFEKADRDKLADWIMQRVEKLHDARAAHYGDDWETMLRFLTIDTIDNKWKDHLHAMEVLKAGVSLRSYAQIDPKNEYKKEGFEKFQLLKTEIAEHVIGFLYKREATDTIREMVTGRLRPQPPQQQQMQLPRTPEEWQALIAALQAGRIPGEVVSRMIQRVLEEQVAAGNIPADVMDRLRRGELALQITPQGLMIGPPPNAQQAAPPAAAGGTPEGALATAGPDGAPAMPAASTMPSPPPMPTPPPMPPMLQNRLAPGPLGRPMATAPKPASQLKPGQAKPGRNDVCPCGSGLKYKKCCAPAFD